MAMSSLDVVCEEMAPEGATGRGVAGARLRFNRVFLLAIWCGLLTGLIEVGVIVLRKHTVDLNRFYWMSRHFVWLIPLTDLLIFVGLGVVSVLLVRFRPGRGSWLASRMLCTLTLLGPVWAGLPAIYGLAGLILALGIAARLV